jgi:hypothetical protein
MVYLNRSIALNRGTKDGSGKKSILGGSINNPNTPDKYAGYFRIIEKQKSKLYKTKREATGGSIPIPPEFYIKLGGGHL